MEFSGRIEGFNYNPIKNYNEFLTQQNKINTIPNVDDFNKIMEGQIAKTEKPESDAGTFMETIKGAFSSGLNSVNEDKLASERLQLDFAMGKNVSIHDLTIAAEKSSLSMQMALQIRNKLQTAYRELTTMGI